MLKRVRDRKRRKGQSMVEYALILCLVTLVCLGVVMSLGNEVYLTYVDIQEAVVYPNDPGSTSPYSCPGGGTATLHGHRYHCQ